MWPAGIFVIVCFAVSLTSSQLVSTASATSSISSSSLISSSTLASSAATGSPSSSATPTSTLSSTQNEPSSSTSTVTNSSSSTGPTSSTSTLSSSSTSSSSTQPTPTLSPDDSRDFALMRQRRLSSIVGALTGSSNIPAWLSTQDAEGRWPSSEIDYTAGCAARRANWPAQVHFQRLIVMAAAWHGGLPGAGQYVKDPAILQAITTGINWWFERDLVNEACLHSGGTAACPCSDTTLWNTNWFSNIILMPRLIIQTCLLVEETLSVAQRNKCNQIPARSYGMFDRNVPGLGFLTGANTLDVARIGTDLALFSLNVTLMEDAFNRVHREVVIKNTVKADGLRPDGSFGQHGGLTFNGNYGKDFAGAILDVEVMAVNTRFAASTPARDAFATYFEGSRWMIYRNTVNGGVLHWDYSALPRFISFPVADNQATANIKLNLTQVAELGQAWGSAAGSTLVQFSQSLSAPTSNANAGRLVGNRIFFANDYMIHRGRDYVSALKMYSTRTDNTECLNSQNPLGFHLADGAQYTYLTGNEYEDTPAAWDWDMIPGITTDYRATPLTCATAQKTGLEAFVGGVSDGQIGIAAMRYTNPITRAFRFQKAWFFLQDDVEHVIISGLSSSTNSSIRSVLDQKRRSGPIILGGAEKGIGQLGPATDPRADTLWHAGIGYVFGRDNSASLTVEVGQRTGNWSLIGTSTQPPVTVEMFQAYLTHQNLTQPVEYSIFPGVGVHEFARRAHRLELETIRSDNDVSAIHDKDRNIVFMVFWAAAGGSVEIPGYFPRTKSLRISTSANALVIYKIDRREVVVSDPSQTLQSLQITISYAPASQIRLTASLPQGGLAGGSVILKVPRQ